MAEPDATVAARRRSGTPRRIVAQLAMGLVLAAAVPVLAAAQGLNLGDNANNNRPIDITADNGIEWQQQAQVYIARGHAVARRGTTEVDADTLVAHYRPSKSKNAQGGNEVYRLDADGHVVIKGPNQTVVGDQAVYDLDRQLAIVTGKALKLTTPTDVVTARDSFEWYDDKQIAVARGDAVAVHGDKHIRADVLTAHLTKTPPAAGSAKPGSAAKTAAPAKPGASPQAHAAGKPTGSAATPDLGDGSSRISRIDAQGNVVVWNATDVGRGDYGVYNADTGIVTLIGHVTLTRGQDVVRGQYAVVDLNRNISRILTAAARPGAPRSQVEGLFVREDTTVGGPLRPHPVTSSARDPVRR
ncbi:MAG TPA: LptA/OstA family protein [Stellaceae bacterium]|nr:LptA/OstA family protein [Stellaceae bacterium]